MKPKVPEVIYIMKLFQKVIVAVIQVLRLTIQVFFSQDVHLCRNSPCIVF
jgi:hypothetical protein